MDAGQQNKVGAAGLAPLSWKRAQSSARIVDHPENDSQPVVYGTHHLLEQGNGRIQQFLSISQQPVPCGSHMSINVCLVLTEPGLPSLNGLLAGIGFKLQIIRCQASVQHPHDDIQMVMLVRRQNIWQFPVKLFAARTFQSANAEPDFSSAAKTVMAFAGVPVYQFSSAVRANRCLPARE